MIYISAGHNIGGIKPDPGAVANGYKEAELAAIIRDLTVKELKKDTTLKVSTDKDTERLGEYLKRIETGNGSVVLEFHFDAASPTATGTTILIGDDADRLDKAFAKEIVEKTAEVLKIKNRGVKAESTSHRGKLGLMREQGTVALLEVCFITNTSDLKAFQDNKRTLAVELAKIIKKYEFLI
jgi:N-acetylmuramoyl-L-alanine amidase